MESATTLDETIGVMPELLRRASSSLPELGISSRGKYPLDSVHLVGWSEQHGHMVAANWQSDCGFATVDAASTIGNAAEGRSGYLLAPDLPHEPGSTRAPLPATPEGMREYVRLQIESARADKTSIPYGGRIVLADLAQHEMTLTTAGNLGIPNSGPETHYVWSQAQQDCAFNIGTAVATVAQAATAASGTVTVTTNIYVETDATTLTWTNENIFAVPLQIEHTANITSVTKTGTANGFGYVKSYWSISGGGGSSGVVFGPLTPVGAAEANYSTVDQVIVGAGLTITVRCAIGAQEFIGTGNVVTSFANVYSRLTALR